MSGSNDMPSGTRGPRKRSVRAIFASKKTLHHHFWGFADQALISASNFVVMVLLARELGPKEFGAFIVAYTVLLFTNSLQGALFTQPHNVLGATKVGGAYNSYTTATALAQVIFSCGAGIAMCSAGIWLHQNNQAHGPLVIAMAPTSVVWQLQEFARRVMYTNADYTHAFFNDSFAYGGQVVGLTLIWLTGNLTAVAAIGVLGLSMFIGVLVGTWQLRHTLELHMSRATFVSVHRENWLFGRWLFGSSTMSWLSSQLYPLLTAGLIGTAATGGMRAAQTFFGPTHILLKSMEAMAPSRAAQAFQPNGKLGLQHSLRRIALPVGACIIAYCVIVAFFASPLVSTFMGHEYTQYSWFIRVYAVYYALTLFISIASISLRSMGISAPLFFAHGLAAVFVLSVGVILVHRIGLPGTAIGLMTSNALILSILWYRLHGEPECNKYPSEYQLRRQQRNDGAIL